MRFLFFSILLFVSFVFIIFIFFSFPYFIYLFIIFFICHVVYMFIIYLSLDYVYVSICDGVTHLLNYGIPSDFISGWNDCRLRGRIHQGSCIYLNYGLAYVLLEVTLLAVVLTQILVILLTQDDCSIYTCTQQG